MRLNKEDMVRKVSKDTKYSPDVVREITESLLGNVVSATVGGEKVSISGFGTFEPVEKKARTGRNICAGRPVHIPAHVAPVFRPAKAFKEAVYREVKPCRT